MNFKEKILHLFIVINSIFNSIHSNSHYNGIDSESPYLRWRSIEFSEHQQFARFQMNIPIVYAGTKYYDILVDRSGYILVGALSEEQITTDPIRKQFDGELSIMNYTIMLAPMKISWSGSQPLKEEIIRYRSINPKDSLLDCTDKLLIKNLSEILELSNQNSVNFEEILLVSWLNLSIMSSNMEVTPKVSFEIAIITSGLESYAIIHYLSSYNGLGVSPIDEPLMGVFSKIGSVTLSNPLKFSNETWNSIHILQLDNLEQDRELKFISIMQSPSNNSISQNYSCSSNSWIEALEGSKTPEIDKELQADRQSFLKSSAANSIICDTQNCADKGSQCLTLVNGRGKCCQCVAPQYIGDGVTCLQIPSAGDSKTILEYYGQILVENDNKKLGAQKLKLAKLMNRGSAEQERVMVSVDYSNTSSLFNLLVYNMPTFFFIPMWIGAEPLDGGLNLMQLSGGSFESLKGLCSFGKLAMFYFNGVATRTNPKYESYWMFTVKVFGGNNIKRSLEDVEKEEYMYELKFRKNTDVLIESTINLQMNGQVVPFKCRIDMKINRGCIQNPDLENKVMFLILQRISSASSLQNGIFYVSKPIVTMNPCRKISACPNPNTMCVQNTNDLGSHTCVCIPGFEEITGVCQKSSVSPTTCSPICHPEAVCNNKKCVCKSGFSGNGYSCFNCNQCDPNADCLWENNMCRCRPNFTGSGFICRPNSSCIKKCHKDAKCINRKCVCNGPLIGDGVNNCFDCMRCNINADCAPFSNRCFCKPGFSGDGFSCQKVSFQRSSPTSEICGNQKKCHKNAICQSNQRCVCKAGYQGDGVQICVDCRQCHKDAFCDASRPQENGCKCRPGLLGDGINQCRRGAPDGNCFPPCTLHAICTASNRCQCRPNYFGDAIQKCQIDCSKCDKNANCDVADGYCKCRHGYFGDGFSCTMNCCTDECHSNAQCVDGKCTCRPGYVGDGIKNCFKCEMCDRNADCNLAALQCQCKSGYQGNGFKCEKICQPACHSKAYCYNGVCRCQSSLVGDGINSCFDCKRCDVNAECKPQSNSCVCRNGYQGDGFKCSKICQPRCHSQAQCFDGICRCQSGFTGDGVKSCFDCRRCDDNSDCRPDQNLCICRDGYQGDGRICSRICKPQCHRQAQCYQGVCRCQSGLTGDGINSCFDCKTCDPNADCRPDRNTCECKPGYRGNGMKCSKMCQPPCHSKAYCLDGACRCQSGLVGDGIKYCFDCRRCHANADCRPDQNMCLCKSGYQGDGIMCSKICQPNCHVDATCTNGACVCKPGYIGDGITSCFSCQRCDPNADCDPPRQRCICRSNYEGNGFTCRKRECRPGCHRLAQCVNGQCQCQTGLTGDGIQCFDCSRCSVNGRCEVSAEKCVCNPGFIGDGVTCAKICNPSCGQNAVCLNGICKCLPGLSGDPIRGCYDCSKCSSFADCDALNYRCVCRAGYTGNGIFCVKEKIECPQKCHSLGRCINKKCECAPGLTGDGINFCFNCAQCHSSADCNPVLSRCVCKSGYQGDGIQQCNPIKQIECQQKCHQDALCINQNCICKPGFIGNGIDFCYNCQICHSKADCQPHLQRCQCKSGYEGDGFNCRLIGAQCPQKCHSNAQCINRRCQCRSGFIGDGVNQCTSECPQKCHSLGRCNNKKCECAPGLTGDGINFCFNCAQCHSNADCNPVLSRCVCKSGYQGDGIQQCNPIKQLECQQKCHQDALCINQNCICKPGFIGNGINFCYNCQICHPNADCQPHLQRCQCKSGYEGDGFNCRLIGAQCPQKCHSNAQCINRRCQCRPGFIGDGVNQCTAGCTPFCHPLANCINGKCVCQSNLIGDGVGGCYNCSQCDPNAQCKSDAGCVCLPGYQGNGRQCIRSGSPQCPQKCHSNAQCINRRCQCRPGFIGNGVNQCTPVCVPRCHPSATCNNGQCVCSTGYQGDGVQFCVKIKDCPQTCHRDALCINQNCVCKPGFVGNGISNCFNCQSCHANAECSPNKQKCQCKPGYQGDGITCRLSDPVLSLDCSPTCHPFAKCFNRRCVCQLGLVGDGINNCYDCSRCDQNAQCIPSQSRCVCNNGFQGNGLKCAPITSMNCAGKCHQDALCIQNVCLCKPGLTGDGTNYCFDCSKCDPNARCTPTQNQCVCRPQFQGNGYSCTPIQKTNCSSTCHRNAVRSNGCCTCKTGFYGDGVINCFDCSKCSPDADCLAHMGKCKCREGFEGNGEVCKKKECKPRCPANLALCIQNHCFCLPGLIGDGRKCIDCRLCHPQATCDLSRLRCVCSPGYQGDGIRQCLPISKPTNKNQCSTSNDCRTDLKEVCLSPNNVCGCPASFVRDLYSNSCITKTCQPACHIRATCIQGKCTCQSGYLGDGITNCISPHKCQIDSDCKVANEICRTSPTSLTKQCICKTGYSRQANKKCELLPSCQDKCHSKAVCILTSANKAGKCICQPGYQGDGVTSCHDCSKCGTNSICSNTKGCICLPGFVGNGIQCVSMNECSDERDCITVRGSASTCVAMVTGSRKCICRNGYTLKEGQCKPLDCIFPCVNNATCIMQTCLCNPGFVGNGYISCHDCNKCHKDAQCHPQNGCICKAGYKGDGIKCLSEDECNTDKDCCDPNRKCVANKCMCKKGYLPMGKTCLSIPCTAQCHSNADCVAGVCTCKSGFQGNGITCRVNDQCKSNRDCPYQNQECIPQQDNSLMCVCKSGYQWQPSVAKLQYVVNAMQNVSHLRVKRSTVSSTPGCMPISCKPKCHKSSLCVLGTCICPVNHLGNGLIGCYDCTICHKLASCTPNIGCLCKSGYLGDGITTCKPQDQCKFNNDCPDKLMECIQVADTSRKCICQPGSALLSGGTKCVPLKCKPDCHPNAICTNLNTQCVCQPGYVGNGTYCKESHKCAVNQDCKIPNSRCEMMTDYVKRCVCLPGFEDKSGRCVEKECSPKCHPFAKCLQQSCFCLPGFYGDGRKSCTSCSLCHSTTTAMCLADSGCRCRAGYQGDGLNCRLLDDCRIDADCRDPNKKCLLDSKAKNLQCFCKAGFIEINNVCLPTKCTQNCKKNANCILGKCVCNQGYQGDGTTCLPSNECSQANPCADKYAMCVLIPPLQKFRCICLPGYKSKSAISPCEPIACPVPCHPLAQCKEGVCVCPPNHIGNGIKQCLNCAICHPKSVCSANVNQKGCVCIPGYQGNGLNCRPADQCRYDSDCRDNNARCLVAPLIGAVMARQCVCQPGYNKLNNNSICEPNPCQGNCGPPSKGFQCQLGACVCRPGYTVTSDGKNCLANDHCQKHSDCPDLANQICVYIPLVGGKRCMCRDGYLPQSPFKCTKKGCARPCHQYAICHPNTDRCECRLGFAGDGVVQCHDCSLCDNRQGNRSICSPTRGCVCRQPEYNGDGSICRRQDSCRLDSDCSATDPNSFCGVAINNPDANLACICKFGFIRAFGARLCVPIPCIKPCGSDQICKVGTCVCRSGFAADPNDSSRCIASGQCNPIQPMSCSDPMRVCTPLSPINPSIGSCLCRPGFFEKSGFCLPKNCYEPCQKNAYCNQGKCTCNPGYQGDGIKQCINMQPDECQNNADCSSKTDPVVGSICLTKTKPYVCQCPLGVIKAGFQCQSPGCSSKCHKDAKCILGQCKCNPKFYGNGYHCEPTCTPMQSCPDSNAVCQILVASTPAIATCVCKPGYIKVPGIKVCLPLDCNPACHTNGQCVMGTCFCLKPFVGDGVATCKEPDDCASDRDCKDANSLCQSVGPKKKCLCKSQYKFTNNKCVPKAECQVNKDCTNRFRCYQGRCVCPQPFIVQPITMLCDLPSISVVPAVVRVIEGTNVDITCFYETGLGNADYLSWRRISPLVKLQTSKKSLKSGSITLALNKVNSANSGIYQCCLLGPNPSLAQPAPIFCKFASVSVENKKCGNCPTNELCDPLSDVCVCNPGYMRNTNGQCKLRNNCLYFPNICDRLTQTCSQGTCICLSIYYKDPTTGICVLKSECITNRDCAPQAICKTDKRCHCGSLYFGPGKVCQQIKLGCEVKKDCDPNASCIKLGSSLTRVCQCKSGFIGDGKVCKMNEPQSSTLIGQSKYIWTIRNSQRRTKRSIVPTKEFNSFLWKQFHSANEIAVISTNCRTQDIYWTLNQKPGLFSATYSKADSPKPMILSTISLTHFIIDHISGNIFWTSKSTNSLGVTNPTNKQSKILFSSLNSPNRITINPSQGELFWITDDSTYPIINFALSDGTEYRPLIVQFTNRLLVDIVYDKTAEKLCWLEVDTTNQLMTRVRCLHQVVKDAILLHPQSLSASSSVIETLFEGSIGIPFALSAFASKLMWVAQDSKLINYLYVYGSQSITRFRDVKNLEKPFQAVAILPEKCGKETNSCSTNHLYGNCNYLCLPTKNGGRTCSCPMGMENCKV